MWGNNSFCSIFQHDFLPHRVIFSLYPAQTLGGWSILSSYSNWKITVICRFKNFWGRLYWNCLTYGLDLHHFLGCRWGQTRGIWPSLWAIRGILLLILPGFNNPRIFMFFFGWKSLLKIGVKADDLELVLRILIFVDVDINGFPILVHSINFNNSALNSIKLIQKLLI